MITMTEREKMLEGEWYQENDEELQRHRLKAKDLCFDLNHTRPSDVETQNEIIEELFTYQPTNL